MWCKEKGNKFPIITQMCEVLRKEKVQFKKKKKLHGNIQYFSIEMCSGILKTSSL